MAPPMRNTTKTPDAARGAHRPKRGAKPHGTRDSGDPSEGWIWGRHAVLAALANPRRQPLSLHLTRNAEAELDEAAPRGLKPQIHDPKELSAWLPDGAVHQGFALKARALEPEPLQAVADPTHGLVVVLDQITDPHNVGAIFRTAAAFGARALVMQDRKSPPLFGALCKTAVGCAETVGHVRVTNIADTLQEFREAGRFVIGLAGEAEASLDGVVAANAGPGLVIVMGSEDKGLRPRVADHCDALARIPMGPKAESLNVSNAAAIALYEASRRDTRINPPR
jgi:23S rRNA (guanosine2251-2'-O)-methyltransferase